MKSLLSAALGFVIPVILGLSIISSLKGNFPKGVALLIVIGIFTVLGVLDLDRKRLLTGLVVGILTLLIFV